MMNNFEHTSDLFGLVLQKIEFGNNLIHSLSEFGNLEGLQKLKRKIQQELNFLAKIYKEQTIKKEHLQCSNLTHFTALINTLRGMENCMCVNKVFTFKDRKITVDIVCNGGLSWVKVIARNPKSLSQISNGDTGYGVRSIIDQAEEFVECSKLYPCLFQTPKITFVFANGICNNLGNELESLGIIVKGTRLKDINEDLVGSGESELSTKNSSSISKINLDVSAMLAYVSSVTNGSCNKYKFSVPVLAQQAEWESKRPVKPVLDAFFKEKKLYCCHTALNSFNEIVNTVGGPSEQRRANEFLQRLTVLPDNATAVDTIQCNTSEIFDNKQFSSNKKLYVGGKIRERSLIIFTFGDRIQAVTVTANDGFVRAARQQGINFVVFVHESRALTEQKEQRATKIKD